MCAVVLAVLLNLGSRKSSYAYAPFLGKRPPVKPDPLKFMQRVRSEIALSTMGTTDDGNVLNHEQILPFPITPGDTSNLSAGLTTEVAFHHMPR